MDSVIQMYYISYKPYKEVPMAANALIQTRIDAEIKDRAAAVLEGMGLTVSDAVRILLTRVAHEGGLPVGLTIDSATYDEWFRAKVKEALEDSRPPLTHDEVEARFAERRARARRKHTESL